MVAGGEHRLSFGSDHHPSEPSVGREQRFGFQVGRPALDRVGDERRIHPQLGDDTVLVGTRHLSVEAGEPSQLRFNHQPLPFHALLRADDDHEREELEEFAIGRVWRKQAMNDVRTASANSRGGSTTYSTSSGSTSISGTPATKDVIHPNVKQ